jgi:hypothetical protein
MALFRIRRPVRLLPGPRLSLSQSAAPVPFALRGTHATFDRRAQRTPAGARATGNDLGPEDERSMNDSRKQQTSAVAVLIAAVVVLWLVLFLMGHH